MRRTSAAPAHDERADGDAQRAEPSRADDARREDEREQQEPCVAEDREPGDRSGRSGHRQRAPLVREEREQDERAASSAVEDLAVDVDVVPDEVRVQRRHERGDQRRSASMRGAAPIASTSSAVATATSDLREPDRRATSRSSGQ